MNSPRRSIGLVILFAAALGGPSLQTGRSETAARSGPDTHASSGTGLVDAKDVRGATVSISGEVYGVTPATRIFGAHGEPIALDKLPVARVFRDEPRVDTDAIVSFEATETSRGWVLEVVRVQGELPR